MSHLGHVLGLNKRNERWFLYWLPLRYNRAYGPSQGLSQVLGLHGALRDWMVTPTCKDNAIVIALLASCVRALAQLKAVTHLLSMN